MTTQGISLLYVGKEIRGLGFLRRMMGVPSVSPVAHGRDGIYRIYGDSRPLLPKLKQLKHLVDEGKDTAGEYNSLLDSVLCMTCKPLGPEYEAAVLPSEYLEFRRKYEMDGPYTFEKFINSQFGAFVALVKIIEGNSRWRCTSKFEPLRVYRGAGPADGTIGVPTVTGFEDGWFLPEEICLIVCFHSTTEDLEFVPGAREWGASGPCGRLPLDGGRKFALSFAPNEDYWTNFPSYLKDGMHFVEWASLEEYLLKLPSS